jgi:hypothetical protein
MKNSEYRVDWPGFPPDFIDPVIEAYKRDVDRGMLRANLQLSVAERFEQFDNFGKFCEEISRAGEQARQVPKSC